MHYTITYISPTKCTARQFSYLVTTYYFPIRCDWFQPSSGD